MNDDDDGVESTPDEFDAGPDITPVYTQAGLDDLLRREDFIRNNRDTAAEEMRRIRVSREWKLHRNETGGQRFDTYDDYCGHIYGESRQWVTREIHRYEAGKILAELYGETVPKLTRWAAQGLFSSGLQAAGGMRTVLQEAKDDGVKLTSLNLRTIISRRVTFADGVAAKTYDQYKQDCELWQLTFNSLNDIVEDEDIVYDSIYEIRDLPDGLKATNTFIEDVLARSKRKKKFPGSTITKYLSGETLKMLCAKLVDILKPQPEPEIIKFPSGVDSTPEADIEAAPKAARRANKAAKAPAIAPEADPVADEDADAEKPPAIIQEAIERIEHIAAMQRGQLDQEALYKLIALQKKLKTLIRNIKVNLFGG